MNKLFLLSVFIFMLPLSAFAEGVVVGQEGKITWNQNTETDLAGYKVYLGTSSNIYNTSADVGLTPSPATPTVKILDTFPGLTDGQYYVVVTAQDGLNESGFSNEVPFVFNGTSPAPPTNVIVVP